MKINSFTMIHFCLTSKTKNGKINQIMIFSYLKLFYNIRIKPKIAGEPPKPRFYHAACLLDKEIVIFGGNLTNG